MENKMTDNVTVEKISETKEKEDNKINSKPVDDNKINSKPAIKTYKVKPVEEWKAGDLVWAKFDDFCYWPGRIATSVISDALKQHKKGHEAQDKLVCVLFYGLECSYGLVNVEYVCDFKENYTRYCKEDETDDFKHAIKMANENEKFLDPPLELQVESTVEVQKETLPEPKTGEINEAGDITENTLNDDNNITDNNLNDNKINTNNNVTDNNLNDSDNVKKVKFTDNKNINDDLNNKHDNEPEIVNDKNN
ncbi:hypothetical protein EHP00_2020 [Ecytonucleospora hepatopenaei]|uniref:PWWP domain-containing protein n=1 Tax=Ecytonucleospora hepatopenaei TaxID=646526 RepID=A0A1W0E831_9MICR|nr:hypothetical protein EHP00_2020 [Ecytonucleospora hepatopenaei]